MGLLEDFPEDRTSALILGSEDRSLFSVVAGWFDDRIDAAASPGAMCSTGWLGECARCWMR